MVLESALVFVVPTPGLPLASPPGCSTTNRWICEHFCLFLISGPAASPYEGGLFYIYMKVPLYYPFYPPEVRFLTRILHPNVSRHGDVGIDLILQHNWSCGMTLSKVLISKRQSLHYNAKDAIMFSVGGGKFGFLTFCSKAEVLSISTLLFLLLIIFFYICSIGIYF